MPGLNSILGLLSVVQTAERELSSGAYIKKSLETKSDEIVGLNIEQLEDYGVNSLGVKIDTYMPYAPYTIWQKKTKGQPYDRVTLRDTGAFHRSFGVEFDPSSFYITASDGKTDGLVDKYGPAIFGLTPENRMKLVRQYVLPDVLKSIRQEIFR